MLGYSDLKILESRKSEKKVNTPFPVPSHLKMEFRIIETEGRIAQIYQEAISQLTGQAVRSGCLSPGSAT